MAVARLGKRVFLRYLTNQMAIPVTGTGPGGHDVNTQLGADVFIAEEDMTLIGATLYGKVGSDWAKANAGSGETMAALSTFGTVFLHDGIILSVHGVWSVGGAMHIGQFWASHQAMMFPEGKGVIIKEEGKIYLHGYMSEFDLETGQTLSMDCGGVLYLVKGAAE